MMFRATAVLPSAGAALLFLIGLWLPQGSHAAPVCAAPEGRRVLQLHPPQDGTPQACDLKGLEKLPAREIVATLPEALGLAGEHRWKGVSLRYLVELLGGGEHSQIRLRALNDYAIEIPWSDLVRYDPILAYHRDGERMGIRDKGPLILIYPFGTHPQLQGQDYINRSIWQVHAVTLR
ncbi:MAG: oxidoreductase [Acidovorax sp.]|nr:oxidoreductase [Acidovorax sp.]